ncbi:hypothetical protein KOI40_16095 [Aestuariicella sp. G3-2]|uniref:hypothetical protein n=1 Tax=Pseudomaricurvus albidus TaxID=2842452 RepID=UPI001C0D2E21|nr:hypothetical protein [Aestuariicella albida]MBU3071348.1 hypothetical protein [Aestuariicella albida]
MAKFTPPQKNKGPIRTTLRIPTGMLNKMDQVMLTEGYNKKQRSLWIGEAIENLIERGDFPGLVAEEFIVPGSTKSIPIALSEDIVRSINDSLNRIEEEEDTRKDRSALIRTAIIQRIMSQQGMQLSPQETGS